MTGVKKTLEVDFYEDFKCLGADCPYTCCKGWNIVIDTDTKNKYKKESGLKGLILSLFATKVKSELNCMRRDWLGHCSFHTRDKLCYFQKMGREDLMPEVCRKYPRIQVDYGKYIEASLSLSCYQACCLLLTKEAETTFIEAKKPMTAKWRIGNRDDDFLAFVCTNRGGILDYVWSEGELLGKLTEIYQTVYAINYQLSRNRIDLAMTCQLPLDKSSEICGQIPILNKGKADFYPLVFIDKIINEILVKSETCRKFTFMSKVIFRYNKKFSKLPQNRVDDFFLENYHKMLSDNSKIAHYLKNYYSYIILQNYSLAYEDYYVLGPVLMANFSLETIILFLVSEYLNGKELTLEYVASIICNVEKMTRHNMDMDKLILDRIRDSFF